MSTQTTRKAAREADALEGVVWENAEAVLQYTSVGWAGTPKKISDRDQALVAMCPPGWTAIIAAHAHAQLAREAREAAPVQPAALTLEQARAMLESAGATVTMPKIGGFERPDLALARAMSTRGMSDADRWRYTDIFNGRDDGDLRADDDCLDAEIARLRALGVTPAVLS